MINSIVTWLMQFLGGFAANNPVVHTVLVILGSLVLAAQAIVLATPSTADDAWWAKLTAIPYIGPFLLWLVQFAPFHKDAPAPKS